MSNHKKCRRCKNVRPKSDFVDTSGLENPRGHYCKSCHIERMKEWYDEALAEERSKIPKLKIIYGKYWENYAWPNDFSLTLYEERDFCPYCGESLPPQYLAENESTVPFRGRAHIDHMDPLSKGGEDSIRNAVYVCDKCNYEKGDIPFSEWMKKLNTKYRRLALEIYTKKHGHTPDEFEIGEPTPRAGGVNAELLLDEGELKKDYPRPIVDGPPSNEPITIEISLEGVMSEPEIKELLSKMEGLDEFNR